MCRAWRDVEVCGVSEVWWSPDFTIFENIADHLSASKICRHVTLLCSDQPFRIPWAYVWSRGVQMLTFQEIKKYYILVDFSGGSRIFPRGGREPSRGGVNTSNFPENCMKSKEFGRPGGGVRPSRPPLDPPMDFVQVVHRFSLTQTIFGEFRFNHLNPPI